MDTQKIVTDLRDAAKRVATGRVRYSCAAAEYESREAREMYEGLLGHSESDSWLFVRDFEGTLSAPVSVEAAKHHRVMALLFAAEIIEQGDVP